MKRAARKSGTPVDATAKQARNTIKDRKSESAKTGFAVFNEAGPDRVTGTVPAIGGCVDIYLLLLQCHGIAMGYQGYFVFQPRYFSSDSATIICRFLEKIDLSL